MLFFCDLSTISDAAIESNDSLQHQPFSVVDGCPILTEGGLNKEDVDDSEKFVPKCNPLFL